MPRGDCLAKPCGAPAPQNGRCFWHDPERRAARLDASRRGGTRKATALVVPPAMVLLPPSSNPRGCPRCRRGDMIYDYDVYGPDIYCLQCGHRQTDAELAMAEEERFTHR